MNTVVGGWRGLVLASLSVVLAGCWGGHDGDDNQNNLVANPQTSTVKITGTAAIGAAISGGKVTAVNAKGVTAEATTAADGSYSLSIEQNAPYMLQVSQGETVLYSYAPAAGVANITPLTNLAYYIAAEGDDVPGHFNNFEQIAAEFSIDQINADIQKAVVQINANLQTYYTEQGLTATSYNFFNTPFVANQTGIDAVLDQLNIQINYQAETVAEGASIQLQGQVEQFPFNFNIETSGYAISFTEQPGTGGGTGTGNGTVTGTWRLTGSVTMSGTTTAIPAQEVPAVSVPANVQDAKQSIEQMAISGNAGGTTIDLTVTNVQVETDIDGVVGDSVSVSATVNGSVSGIPLSYSYSLKWERIQ